MTDPGLARSRRTAHTCSTLTCSSLNCGLASRLPQLHSVTARAVLVACNRRPPDSPPPDNLPTPSAPWAGLRAEGGSARWAAGLSGAPSPVPKPPATGPRASAAETVGPSPEPGASGRLAAQEQAGAVGNGRRGTRPAVCWLPNPRGRAQPLSAGNKDGSCPKRRIGRLGLSGSVRRPVCGGYR